MDHNSTSEHSELLRSQEFSTEKVKLLRPSKIFILLIFDFIKNHFLVFEIKYDQILNRTRRYSPIVIFDLCRLNFSRSQVQLRIKAKTQKVRLQFETQSLLETWQVTNYVTIETSEECYVVPILLCFFFFLSFLIGMCRNCMLLPCAGIIIMLDLCAEIVCWINVQESFSSIEEGNGSKKQFFFFFFGEIDKNLLKCSNF